MTPGLHAQGLVGRAVLVTDAGEPGGEPPGAKEAGKGCLNVPSASSRKAGRGNIPWRKEVGGWVPFRVCAPGGLLPARPQEAPSCQTLMGLVLSGAGPPVAVGWGRGGGRALTSAEKNQEAI